MTGENGKRKTDGHLNSITYGIRRRVARGKAGDELFARSRQEWFGRVSAMADAVKASAAREEYDGLVDAAAALCAATYFATVPEAT